MSVLIRARPTIQVFKHASPPEMRNLIRKKMIWCSYSTFWDEFNLCHFCIKLKHLTVHYGESLARLLLHTEPTPPGLTHATLKDQPPVCVGFLLMSYQYGADLLYVECVTR